MKTIYTAGQYSVVTDTAGVFYYIKDEKGFVLAPKVQYVEQGILTYAQPKRAITDCKRLANQ